MAQLLKHRSRNEDCLGRTERQRVSASQLHKNIPEPTLLGPAYIHQTMADRELIFQNRQRTVSLAFHRQASATI